MSDRRQGDFPPSITAGKLYERTSANGRTYISGFLGPLKVTAIRTDDVSEKGDAIWTLRFAETPPRNQAKGSKAEAERPRPPPAMGAGSTPIADSEIPF